MRKKWPVGGGTTSWDIDIAELKDKGSPQLDLAMELPELGALSFPPYL
jgi:hypothetical protein